MKAAEIRQKFLEFFSTKGHKIVPSAPIVNKNDPSLMFTNAGMNQFKDYFLGNKIPSATRMTDTQKCLRVSGKQNDLEEVGVDSYHHTMFEMLGNWSFGDYFKKEAISWAWELLVDEFKLPVDRLYATVFEGDKADKLGPDDDAVGYWKKFLPEDRILYFDRKDNFWEMGETGPCGPCSEIHIDLRSDEERAQLNGRDLVNMDHPQVIEIWNLVFIQFNRKANRELEPLPANHIDTGMGLERLCMAMQGKLSNYDTDLFAPFIELIENETGQKYTATYGPDAKKDIAFRVLVDHVRAVSFVISDGQSPHNTGAGYVIRRILRRAVRYYYSFLDRKTPLLYIMVDLLAERFKDVFPELNQQRDFVRKTILEEEKSFLRTLEQGLKRLEEAPLDNNVLSGDIAFQLYDRYGFPIDLITLIGSEKGFTVDEEAFNQNLARQRKNSSDDAAKEVGDWTILINDPNVNFRGYDDTIVTNAKVVKHRTVVLKGKPQYQLVLNETPFYPEGGGQVGDTGLLLFGDEKIAVLDTKKENDLIIHIVKTLPSDFTLPVKAEINSDKRLLTENNHSATHLMHSALKQVLGDHVQQRGSLVNDKYLRFDFSHFQAMTSDEISQVEAIVNRKIRKNIELGEARSIPINEAKTAGATMLFGEKYGETVRMITFDKDYSIELCGGCHVDATGKIGFFKITSEGSVATGIRRIEAITANAAEAFINKELAALRGIRSTLKNPKDIEKQVNALHDENRELKKQVERFITQQANMTSSALNDNAETVNGIRFIGAKVDADKADTLKQIATQLRKSDNTFVILGAEISGKAHLAVALSDDLISKYQAGAIVREVAKNIQGGGGGQPFMATAGGKNPAGIDQAVADAKALIS